MNENLTAFLTTISQSEGTEHVSNQHGYNVICGGGIFISYKDHPRKLIDLPRLKIKSTAAGRYQILAKYFDVYKKQLGLPDFSPDSQDKIAIQLTAFSIIVNYTLKLSCMIEITHCIITSNSIYRIVNNI